MTELPDQRIIYQNLPTTIGGFIKETDGFYTIVLNSRMTFERNRETYADETDHIDNRAFGSELSADQIEMKSHGKLL